MLHRLIGLLYHLAAFYPRLQDGIALLGDTILTKWERHADH